jgi:hypothetical protein
MEHGTWNKAGSNVLRQSVRAETISRRNDRAMSAIEMPQEKERRDAGNIIKIEAVFSLDLHAGIAL